VEHIFTAWFATTTRVPHRRYDDVDYATGDVVVFGCEATGGPAVLPVEEAAQAAGTLSYELLVRVGSRVRRDFTGVV